MILKRLIPFTLVIVFCLGGCVTAKQKLIDSGVKPLDDVGLQELLSKPLMAQYVTAKGTSNVEFHPNGSQKFSNSNIADEGKWRILNGEQCSKWNTLRSGQEKCFTWFMVGDKKYDIFDSSGMKRGTLTIK